ncbi:MAG: flagellar export chaperone FliS [Candidatus Coatesbacteria bacterium]|nr:flagellar export chaperone FliS [Candidatus Coatesbacteria bacterium]
MLNQQLTAGRAYQTVQFTTASGPHMVLMFYEGALKFAGLAKRHTSHGNLREAYKFRGKLLNVLSELMRSLVLEKGREEVNSFFFLYDYMSKVVRETMIEQQDASGFDEVLRIMGELRNSWKEMLASNKVANHPDLVLARR